ncbi:hypothetical protein BGX31_011501 [Mortierella sp. GBA43]|nr:hypothetical protein BGX31_011501 [Mortierella sp. GBA43]
MHFAQLFSLPLAIAIVAQTLPQVLAAGPAPQGVGYPQVTVIEGQKLFISDGQILEKIQLPPGIPLLPGKTPMQPKLIKQFFSLDLSIPWTSDAPAWTSLTRRETTGNLTQGMVAATKDKSSLLFFANEVTYRFDIKTSTWDKDPFKTWDYIPIVGDAVTDTDTGFIYGMEGFHVSDPFNAKPIDHFRFTEFDPATKTSSAVVIQDRYSTQSYVYSHATKSLYALDGFIEKLVEGDAWKANRLQVYNPKSKSWSVMGKFLLVASLPALFLVTKCTSLKTGNIEIVSGCFVLAYPFPTSLAHQPLAYGGKKLVLAGGEDGGQAALTSVYMLDLATATWTRMADAPRGSWFPACAANGDSFIYWGGLDSSKDPTYSNDGPIILNMATNTWGRSFTPGGPIEQGDSSAPNPKNSADRMAAALSKVGLVALTLMSVAASSWIVL